MIGPIAHRQTLDGGFCRCTGYTAQLPVTNNKTGEGGKEEKDSGPEQIA